MLTPGALVAQVTAIAECACTYWATLGYFLLTGGACGICITSRRSGQLIACPPIARRCWRGGTPSPLPPPCAVPTWRVRPRGHAALRLDCLCCSAGGRGWWGRRRRSAAAVRCSRHPEPMAGALPEHPGAVPRVQLGGHAALLGPPPLSGSDVRTRPAAQLQQRGHPRHG